MGAQATSLAEAPNRAEQRAQALFVLKRDFETTDDAQLAELEIESLTGFRTVPLCDSKQLGDLTQAAEALTRLGAAERVLVGELSGERGRLLRRLGMVEEIWMADEGESEAPVQATFERLAGASGVERASSGHANRRKNEYLTHSFHKYKAKFFPRMARALANYAVPGRGEILDPFVGSGTLLVEASLMGVPSTGLDIDPLSAYITQSKVDALHLDTAAFEEAVVLFQEAHTAVSGQGSLLGVQPSDPVAVSPSQFKLPDFIGIKMPEERRGIEEEVASVRLALESVPDGMARDLLRVTLSHAIATKVSLRWMGTGDNRFALALGKRSVAQVLTSHIKRLRSGLAQRDALVEMGLLAIDDLAPTSVDVGDVRAMSYAEGSFEGITTSPPYLPASSGRETYLRSRAPSLMALDLLSESEVLEIDQSMIGSILRAPNGQRTTLPAEIVDLVEWMKPQRARAPKALPTAVYFHDLISSMREMGRVLEHGGRLAMVVSTEHVFYDLVSRNIVRRLNMPSAIEEFMAEPMNEIPLKLDRVVKIELPKMDYAARPASRGTYSESIILASKV